MRTSIADPHIRHQGHRPNATADDGDSTMESRNGNESREKDGKAGPALVTGASGGIGLALAERFAEGGHDVVLVARNGPRLAEVGRELEGRYGIRSTVLPADLADPEAPRALARAAAERGLAIDYLVNNAGFGLRGSFATTDIARELEMLQLNVVALTHLTKLFLPGMLERARGGVLNVASTAAFVPGPGTAVYSASKAYVLSFSESLAVELQGTGVNVTALCPGPTRTSFAATAGMESSRLFRSGSVMEAGPVARAGYDGLMKGKPVVLTGLSNRLMVQSLRVSPRRAVARIAKALIA
jgi:short-subunit dehydrogenase